MNLEFDEAKHCYTFNDKPMAHVTGILVDSGLVDAKWFTEFGRDRGSAVHKAIHYHELDDLDESTLDDTVRPFFEAYLKFKAEYQWQPIENELQVWSERHEYAGTLDSYGKAAGTRAIADYKTGQLTPAVGVQLTGYSLALAECRGIVCTKLLGVRLVGDGTYRIQQYKLDPTTFYAALNIARWKKGA